MDLLVNGTLALADILAIFHFVGDFVFQSHWMASNKSKNNAALVLHVGIWTGCIGIPAFLALILGIINVNAVLLYIAINFVSHLIIDYISSRITSRLWAKQSWHNFFVAIGFDQLLHFIFLLFSAALVINNVRY